MNQAPELIYLALILPSLFGLTVIAEGVWKIFKNESGWVSVLFGFMFIISVVAIYFFILVK